MRILVLSDIHANLPALEAVLGAVGSFDLLINLGDVVGYGPHPNECVARVRELPALHLVGNHDLGVIDLVALDIFNDEAQAANRWNAEQLTREHQAFLRDLTPAMRLEEGIVLTHASPRSPVWEYVTDAQIARACFGCFDEQLALVGHSHVPYMFGLRADGSVSMATGAEGTAVDLSAGRWLLNPGSVGQPRDNDPRAAYGMLDLDAGVFRYGRVAYDIRATQQAMTAARLPSTLIARLAYGV